MPGFVGVNPTHAGNHVGAEHTFGLAPLLLGLDQGAQLCGDLF